MPIDEATRSPVTSQRRMPARKTLGADEAANAAMSEIMAVVIGFIIVLFVGFLLFDSIGPDSNKICNDPTNYTTEECDDAKTARGMFWTVMILAGVAAILIVIGIATGQIKKSSGGGGGGRRRRR